MRKTPMTFDAIFAALAVLSTSAACSKADRAAAEPPAAPAANAPATAASAAPTTNATAPPPPAEAKPAPPSAAAAADEKSVVDAGKERAPTPAAMPKGGSAACGATGCSADMRKGGK